MNRNIVLKIIVFDLGGTVFSKGKQAFIDLLTEQLCMNREKVVSVIDGSHALAYRRNEISASDYWQIVRRELNVPEKLGDLEKLWFNQYVPIPGMPELIAKLRKHYKVAYLSNNTPERVSFLQQKYKFLDWFDNGLFSYEVGTVKSDGGLYKILLKKFEVITSREILIIDDREQNLTEPHSAGFQTVLFQSPEQLINELQKRGVITVK